MMKSQVEPIAGEPVSDGDDVARSVRTVLGDVGIELARIVTLFPRGNERIDAVVVHGSSAVSAWGALREARGHTGLHPVIVGDARSVALLREGLAESTESVEEILGAASEIDPEHVLGERRAERVSTESGPVPHEEWDEEDERITEEHAAEMTIMAGRDVLSGEPLPEVAIALLPTRDGWTAPAWLGFGGWNECPAPAEHVALMRRWNERWGAEVVSVRSDAIEACIAEAPHDVEVARALAEEHYAYAADIVDQGTGSIERLAASLAGGRVWFFWWD